MFNLNGQLCHDAQVIGLGFRDVFKFKGAPNSAAAGQRGDKALQTKPQRQEQKPQQTRLGQMLQQKQKRINLKRTWLQEQTQHQC